MFFLFLCPAGRYEGKGGKERTVAFWFWFFPIIFFLFLFLSLLEIKVKGRRGGGCIQLVLSVCVTPEGKNEEEGRGGERGAGTSLRKHARTYTHTKDGRNTHTHTQTFGLKVIVLASHLLLLLLFRLLVATDDFPTVLVWRHVIHEAGGSLRHRFFLYLYIKHTIILILFRSPRASSSILFTSNPFSLTVLLAYERISFIKLTLDGSSFLDQIFRDCIFRAIVSASEPWREYDDIIPNSWHNRSILFIVYSYFFLYLFFFLWYWTGLVNAQVTIEPQNVVVRPDQVTRLMCKTRTPIKSCLWEINGELYNIQEGSPYEPLGVLEDGECGIQVNRSIQFNRRNNRWRLSRTRKIEKDRDFYLLLFLFSLFFFVWFGWLFDLLFISLA